MSIIHWVPEWLSSAWRAGLSNPALRRSRPTLVVPGYKGLDIEALVRMRIHGATPEFVRALQGTGYRGLSIEELVRFRIHKVTPAFIRSIHDVGYRTVSIDQLIKMRIHKVDAQFIKDLQADGYRNLTAGDVIDFAIRGPRFMRTRRW